MPIYEYECQTCGTIFEKRQSFKDEPRADCPNGHPDTRRLLAAPAIVFKGSGFYINDSRGNGKSNGASASKSSSNDTNTDSKSESKPENESKASDSSTTSDSKSDTKATTD